MQDGGRMALTCGWAGALTIRARCSRVLSDWQNKGVDVCCGEGASKTVFQTERAISAPAPPASRDTGSPRHARTPLSSGVDHAVLLGNGAAGRNCETPSPNAPPDAHGAVPAGPDVAATATCFFKLKKGCGGAAAGHAQGTARRLRRRVSRVALAWRAPGNRCQKGPPPAGGFAPTHGPPSKQRWRATAAKSGKTATAKLIKAAASSQRSGGQASKGGGGGGGRLQVGKNGGGGGGRRQPRGHRAGKRAHGGERRERTRAAGGGGRHCRDPGQRLLGAGRPQRGRAAGLGRRARRPCLAWVSECTSRLMMPGHPCTGLDAATRRCADEQSWHHQDP